MLTTIAYCVVAFVAYSTPGVFTKDALNRIASAIAWPAYVVVYATDWVRSEIIKKTTKKDPTCPTLVT